MLHVSVYWVSLFAPWDAAVYMQQAGGPREGILSKQQAALAHSWLCPASVTGQVLPAAKSAAFPQAAPQVLSAPAAPAQGSPNRSPCRELPSARCPVLSCPVLMEAPPAPQQQGWALPALGTAQGPLLSLQCPALQRAQSKPRVSAQPSVNSERGCFWLGGRKVTTKCSPQLSPAPCELLHTLSLSENPKSLLSTSVS